MKKAMLLSHTLLLMFSVSPASAGWLESLKGKLGLATVSKGPSIEEIYRAIPVSVGQTVNASIPCPAGYELSSRIESAAPIRLIFWCESLNPDRLISRFSILTIGKLVTMVNAEIQGSKAPTAKSFEELDSLGKPYNQHFVAKVDEDFQRSLDVQLTPALAMMAFAFKSARDKSVVLRTLIVQSVANRFRFDPEEPNFCHPAVYNKFHGCEAFDIQAWVASVIDVARAGGATESSWDGFDTLSEMAISYTRKAIPAVNAEVDKVPEPYRKEVKSIVDEWISISSKVDGWKQLQKNVFREARG